MKQLQALILPLVLLLVTACSRGSAPVSEPATAPQAPATSAPQATAAGAPDSSAPPVQTPAPAPPPSAPVLTQRRAFALVLQTAEAQAVSRRLGSRFVMVGTNETPEAYKIGVGENSPERVRFELHFTVYKADATVSYMDVLTAQEKAATLAAAPADPAADQAEAMLSRGETRAAIDLLTKAVTERPAAQTWNLLSYAYLLERQWQAAVEAGRKALALEAFHPYALYNTGMAELELKQYPSAVYHLLDATEVQPQGTEPYLGLARAYQGAGRYALAVDAVAAALRLAPADAGVRQRQAAVAGMVSHTAPTDLVAAATARLEDGVFTVYLYPASGNQPAAVYLKGPDRVVGLPFGDYRSSGLPATFARVDLPGGEVGYFLAGESVGAYVSGSRAWRLFVRSADGAFRQMVFVGGNESVPRVNDFLRSMGRPSIEGNRVVASYGDDASGKTTISTAWELAPGAVRAVQVEKTRADRDPRK